MDNTTQKMKRIPFDFELAKQGVAIYDNDEVPMFFIHEYEGKLWVKYEGGDFLIPLDGTYYHLIPEGFKKERWAVIPKDEIYTDQSDANARKRGLRSSYYTVVKLAD